VSDSDEAEPEWDAEERELLTRVDFPLFAPEGLQMRVNGWGGGSKGKRVQSVTLRHGDTEARWLDVRTARVRRGEDDDPGDFAIGVLRRLTDGPVDLSPRQASFPVDAVIRPFALVSADDLWAAAGRVEGTMIIVSGRGFATDEVVLRSLLHPEALIEGIPTYRPISQPLTGLAPERVTRLVNSTRLKALSAKFASITQPGFALLETDNPQSSWIGGEPHLPKNASWPRGTHGPMTFIAQFALGDLDPNLWVGTTTGFLHIFCDLDPASGSLAGSNGCVILHTPAGIELQAHRFPDDLHVDSRLHQQMVTPVAGLTLPDPSPSLMHRFGLDASSVDPDDVEAWLDLKELLRDDQGWSDAAGQMLGWATWPNGDLMELLASRGGGQSEDWTLLLHTDALDYQLYVALPTKDIASGRFDTAQATAEQG
jgi:hypothetical protein